MVYGREAGGVDGDWGLEEVRELDMSQVGVWDAALQLPSVMV